MRPYWNAISLINMMTSHHRRSPFLGTRCSLSAWKTLAGSDNFWVFFLTIWSCVALELFNASIKWTLSKLTHHLPYNTRSLSGPSHIWALYSHSPGCPSWISKPLLVLPFFSSLLIFFCEVLINETEYVKHKICDTWNILGTQQWQFTFSSTISSCSGH